MDLIFPVNGIGGNAGAETPDGIDFTGPRPQLRRGWSGIQDQALDDLAIRFYLMLRKFQALKKAPSAVVGRSSAEIDRAGSERLQVEQERVHGAACDATSLGNVNRS